MGLAGALLVITSYQTYGDVLGCMDSDKIFSHDCSWLINLFKGKITIQVMTRGGIDFSSILNFVLCSPLHGFLVLQCN